VRSYPFQYSKQKGIGFHKEPVIIKYLSLLLLLSIIIGCNNIESRKGKCTHKSLELTDSIKLELDSLAPTNWGLALYKGYNGKELLFIQNHVLPSVDIYDLKNQSLAKRVKAPRSGQFKITQLQGFAPISPDSIIIFDRMGLDNAIVYSEGGGFEHLIKEMAIFRDSSDRLINHVSQSIAISELHGNMIHMVEWPILDINDWNKLLAFSWIFKYDLVNQSLIKEIPEFPSIFDKRKYWGTYALRFSRVINDDLDYIFSWGISDSIQIRKQSGRTFTVNASTCKTYAKFEGFSEPKYITEYDKAFIHSIFFTGLFYDKDRDLIHRIAMLPNRNEVNSFNDQTYYAKDIILITLDQNYEIVYETHLDGGKYDIHGSFVGPEGLYIPLNNMLNKNVKEDEVFFHIYGD